ncbi:hypothetical protein TNIN_311821 [Trichonephila inaurata madagascariensis]|uniref:Uncharacterized protein n=1 Tax=Trichonephila inaurata madagascariensis TaxID=2747483 RepID=A0A8X6YKG8_9ARAC|nr:hypothetical protein TNIN_311821 [Trichonephila inaurata madagascariensis]
MSLPPDFSITKFQSLSPDEKHDSSGNYLQKFPPSLIDFLNPQTNDESRKRNSEILGLFPKHSFRLTYWNLGFRILWGFSPPLTLQELIATSTDRGM